MVLSALNRTEKVRTTPGAVAMIHNTDDLRIKEIKELAPPGHVIREFPATEKAATLALMASIEMPRRSRRSPRLS